MDTTPLKHYLNFLKVRYSSEGWSKSGVKTMRTFHVVDLLYIKGREEYWRCLPPSVQRDVEARIACLTGLGMSGDQSTSEAVAEDCSRFMDFMVRGLLATDGLQDLRCMRDEKLSNLSSLLLHCQRSLMDIVELTSSIENHAQPYKSGADTLHGKEGSPCRLGCPEPEGCPGEGAAEGGHTGKREAEDEGL